VGQDSSQFFLFIIFFLILNQKKEPFISSNNECSIYLSDNGRKHQKDLHLLV